ncbi:TRAP transporter small permease [Actinobacillus succinogenes]|uniref:TRAP transporter small permease protein n=1 Tax=Actinobacillus succinogenes (strain ATCC 55618 / DSM 22257 / CCUG 43843 / 130Z) TaxID=339671 RepID=A6VL01_ACTSZ|nr:TRAP transporter small permease [Actinobacillus succinogenes]ABR73648.1 Tripartite ATP-independent periplasmic transporter DctQ component [Actinobacillus succinogenes 130Z]PHI39892.1 TRAP transporter small permease [Actinobacillus succinogenes]
MNALAHFVKKAIEVICVIILSAMSILVFVNVVLRYGFNSSINITEEVSRYMFVWLAFLGAVLAFNDNQHVRVTVFVEKLSPVARKLLHIVTDAAMLFCCYLIVDGSWLQFNLNLNNLAPISGLPQGITYLASTIAGMLIGILIIARMITGIFTLNKGEAK